MDYDSFYINAAINNDYDGFYKREISFRQMMNYPPFADIVEISVLGKNIEICTNKMNEYLNYVGGINILKGLEFLTKREDVSLQTKDKSRVIATCKCPMKLRAQLVKTCNIFSMKMAKDRVGATIMLDVNPY